MALLSNVFYFMRTGTYTDLAPLLRFSIVLADSCVYLCYFLHVTRFRWEKTPPILLYVYLGYFALFELYHTIALFIPEILTFEVDLLILTIPVRLIILTFLIFNYLTIKPENPTSRIVIAKWIWVAVAALLVINYSLNGINLVLYRVPLADLSYLISYPVALLFFVLPILVPEALLITQVQIVRAANLYKLISTFPKENRETLSQDKLLNYILSLPKDLVDSVDE